MAEPDTAGEGTPAVKREPLAALLLASVLVVATCGLIYELLAGTIASYLLGDSVTQFSTVIGTYLFAMGVGSFLSRYVKRDELAIFVRVEVLVAAIGGWSAAVLFLTFPLVSDVRPLLYGIVLAIGMFVGLEIPLLIRILKDRFAFGDLVSNVLTFDYVGALAASLLFPLLLVPYLGLLRTGFAFGLLNVVVALLMLLKLERAQRRWADVVAALAVAGSLVAGLVWSESLQKWSETAVYSENIVYARSTPYQRIVMTRRDDDLRLYLNGNLQFSARDEYRYHEALVWPALGRVANRARVLVLGGGDGLAAREILRDPRVRQVTLVDLDPEMTELFTATPQLAALNARSLSSPRMRIVHADAFAWVRTARGAYDVVIVDFPDPTAYSLGKLYTDTFYRQVARLLAPGGAMAVQSTSPLVAPRSFWTVATTLEAAGLTTRGYHAHVPSFGDWGFMLAGHGPLPPRAQLPLGLRFLTARTEPSLFEFPPDMARRPTPVNRLDNQALVRSFAEEWARYDG